VITGINHVTLSVADVERSFAFYTEVLGCRPVARWNRGAYLAAGNDWLCLSLDSETRSGPSAEYTHVAFSLGRADFSEASERVSRMGVRRWKENASEGGSLYILDPDGHKLELHVGDLESRLEACREAPYEGMVFFD
jgi:catechol 2,3-dioxygenase-like lactoylglutathione lyase family enzyme